MISLLVSGAIGTWITCGGTYYLGKFYLTTSGPLLRAVDSQLPTVKADANEVAASMAFSAMNYFVITRLLGGLVFTLIVASVGFIAFACLSNVSAAIVFALYFVVLTTYLCLLAALANYQFAGSAFQSVSNTFTYSMDTIDSNATFRDDA